MLHRCVAGCIVLHALAASAAGRVEVYYNERPPYLITAADGSVHGLTATPADKAFRAAGIPATWSRVPSNRQLALLREGGQRCAIGWYRTREREQYAKFSRPIYRDQPLAALVSRQLALPPHSSLKDVLAWPGLRVLLKEKYSYGHYVDELLAKQPSAALMTTAENVTMLDMIRAGRASMMFVTDEEADYLLRQAGSAAAAVRLLRFSDVPKGEARHIMCSKDVGDDIMQQLDQSIPAE